MSQYFYAAGKRKTATARVKLHENGSGKVIVNGEELKKYFPGELAENAVSPLALTDNKATFDVEVKVIGGGKAGQSDAMRHGISRSLLLFDPELRITLKRAGFLRRDARVKERKKPGLKSARRSPQWAKR